MSLTGRKIAITEHRYQRELGALIERAGGAVVSCPLLEERPVEDSPEIERFVGELIDPGFDTMIFFTGVGLRFLDDQAVAMGKHEAFLEALGGTRVVARGPKPQAALRKLGLRADLTPSVPTSEGLLELLAAEDLAGKRVGVQLYGTPNEAFCVRLREMGADVRTVQVYDYRSVTDGKGVEALIDRLTGGELDAITFTSAPQVVSLFDHADRFGKRDALVTAMHGPLVVIAVGSVTAGALQARDVPPDVVPGVSKMGPMVEALAAHFGSEGP